MMFHAYNTKLSICFERIFCPKLRSYTVDSTVRRDCRDFCEPRDPLKLDTFDMLPIDGIEILLAMVDKLCDL